MGRVLLYLAGAESHLSAPPAPQAVARANETQRAIPRQFKIGRVLLYLALYEAIVALVLGYLWKIWIA